MRNPVKTTLAVWLVLLPCLAFAQKLPERWGYSTDGHRLVIGQQPITGLYDSATIREVYLTFPQSNYWTLLTQGYTAHTDVLAHMTVGGVVYDSIGVRFKGQTSYQQVNGQKKSFNLSLNTFRPDQEIMGYSTMNLNNSYLDESFLREVFYLRQIRKHIPAAKGCFTHLFINGTDWGLYPHIQQINKDFYKEWFLSNDGTNWRADAPPGSNSGGPGGPGGGGGWGDGKAALNYLGADTALYQPNYTLKSTEKANPWDDLVTVCDVLNNTSTANLPSVLPTYLDIDRTLWFLASEVAFSDDDGYIYKGKMDYYVYYEPETGRMVPQEYDGNSTMDPAHVTWSAFYNETKVNYPLMNKLLAVPAWRQRYLAHLRTIIADELDITETTAVLDNYKSQIDVLVQSDPKKLYTYAQFNSEMTVLKNFITNRRTNLLANSEVAQVAPVISSAYYQNPAGTPWEAPSENETAAVVAQVSSANGIDHVSLHYATGLVGNFTATPMFDDGLHNDIAAGDGIYGAEIPAQAAGTWVRFYVEAAAANAAKSVSYAPVGAEHDVYYYLVKPVTVESGVVINELMASNTTSVTDDAGEYNDWVELYNTSDVAVDLSGYILTDNPANLDKWEIPQGTILQPDSYLILWADEDSSQGPYHMNFKLSASGEQLWLLTPAGYFADSVSFAVQPADMGYARVPNGTGSFQVQAPTFAGNNVPTSIGETVGTTPFMLYPNPARAEVQVILPATQTGMTLEVLTVAGQVLWQQPVEAGENRLDVSGWAAGVYFVRCGNQVGKLVRAE